MGRLQSADTKFVRARDPKKNLKKGAKGIPRKGIGKKY